MDNLDNCDPNADCMNTIGNFTCTCQEGYEGNGIQCSSQLAMSVADHVVIASLLYVQTSMNAFLTTLTIAMSIQLATILKEVTSAPVTLVLVGMERIVVTWMSVSPTHLVVTPMHTVLTALGAMIATVHQATQGMVGFVKVNSILCLGPMPPPPPTHTHTCTHHANE